MSKKNLTKEYYDKNYQVWTDTKTNSFHHEKAFTIFSALFKEKNKIIDIGCAWGIHVPLFLGIGRKLKYEGFDISKPFLKLAKRRYPQLTFYQADISEKKSLPKKKYDGFWAGAVLMHIPYEDWDQMFKNIESITKKGAYGYLSLPTAHPSGKDANSDQRHFTLLNEKEQKSELRKQGWKIIKSGIIDGFQKDKIWKWYIVKLP